VLGFGLSGAVQAFVSRSRMQAALGDHWPRTVAKASFFGMVSLSCSYAASALAKSLFARGADFTSAMIFMVASTNLVVELGVVLPRVIPRAALAQARDSLQATRRRRWMVWRWMVWRRRPARPVP